ncbi:MarR family winged helix-turn-helix transcriptional regulator [Chthonobacter albigriseus]|uniref:MarR family winged helix-turn-helix transcriptional regulator n=1 Tax=Chthonobacter albigriseus TaxID=1683161 RepID=UPI0015EFCE9E|nr:MarR family transcriptional regulator [Chthonobacter albigriseus]
MAESRLSDQLAYIIATVNKQLEDELQERLRPAGVPIEQLRILEVLNSANGRPMGELATKALIEPTTLTKIVDRMVSDGLVFRAPDPSDRRRVLIRIAPGGKTLFRRLDRITTAQEERLQRQIPAAKLDELRRLLTEIMEG